MGSAAVTIMPDAAPRGMVTITPDAAPSLWSRIKSELAPRDPMSMPGAQRPTGTMPGSTEGPGMLEGLSDWDKASFGEMGGGAADMARGNVARGAHRVISGAGASTVPLLPFAAAGAPVALLRTLVGGYAGGKAGQAGAEALGADEDQAALAGDVGNLAGGYGAYKVGDISAPNLAAKVKATGSLAAQDAASHIPVVGRLARRPSISDYIAAARTKAPTPVTPEYPGAPLPATPPPEFFNPSLVSPSRTLPGMHSPEVVSSPAASSVAQQAAPLPSRPGLALPPGPAGVSQAEAVPVPAAPAETLAAQVRASAPQSGPVLPPESGTLAEQMRSSEPAPDSQAKFDEWLKTPQGQNFAEIYGRTRAEHEAGVFPEMDIEDQQLAPPRKPPQGTVTPNTSEEMQDALWRSLLQVQGRKP